MDVNGSSYGWEQADVTAAPAHARVALQNRSSTHPAFLFLVDDAPLQRKLKIYMERDW
jgi:gentisate 1,2-dioxygenase